MEREKEERDRPLSKGRGYEMNTFLHFLSSLSSLSSLSLSRWLGRYNPHHPTITDALGRKRSGMEFENKPFREM
jgi:hypothetical protein